MSYSKNSSALAGHENSFLRQNPRECVCLISLLHQPHSRVPGRACMSWNLLINALNLYYVKTPVISQRLDLYRKLKNGPEPMEALAAYGKPTASLRQTYGRKWLWVLVPDVWQIMTSADPSISYGKTYSKTHGKPTANLWQTYGNAAFD